MLVAHLATARRHGTASPRRRVPLTQPPLLIESDYAARLVAIVDRMREASRHLVADLPLILRTDSAGWRLDDHPGRRARRTMERVRAEVDQTTNATALEGLAEGFARRVSTHQRDQIARQARAGLGVDVAFRDPRLAEIVPGFVHENVSLITSLQGRTLDGIETLITRAVASGTRADAVAAEIEARWGIAERHARLIARDQIGKLNSQITTERHLELGLTVYRWRSMRDPKVRPEHKIRDGQTYAYNGPGAAPTRPGLEICCRCLEEPVFDSILDALT